MSERASKDMPEGRWRELKPWLWVTDKNEIVCLICPLGGCWIHKPRTRAGMMRAIRTHRRCGYLH